MGAETIGLLVVTGVIVAMLALYLITIGLALTRLNKTLGSVVAGLTLIRDRSAPVGGVLGEIVAEVEGIEESLDALLAAVGGSTVVPVVSSMGDAVARARSGAPTPAAEVDGEPEAEPDGQAEAEPVMTPVPGGQAGAQAQAARATGRGESLGARPQPILRTDRTLPAGSRNHATWAPLPRETPFESVLILPSS